MKQIDMSDEENLGKVNIRCAKTYFNYKNRLDVYASSDSSGRAADTKLFYYELQNKYYSGMYDFLRKLGYKALITGSNHWEQHDAELLCNAGLDFIDRHCYYDNPDFSGGWELANIRFRNRNELFALNNNIFEVASMQIKGLPFFVSEWNIAFPNEYRVFVPVLMSAYANLQGWDAMLQFSFEKNKWSPKFDTFLDTSQSPALLSQWVPAAMIYYKGYVKPAKNTVVDKIGDDNIFYNKNSSFRFVGYDFSMPLISKTAKEYAADKPSEYQQEEASALIQKYHNKDRKEVKSDTEEIVWDYGKGILYIDTPCVQGAAGNIGEEHIKLNDIEIESDTSFCSIFITSMDGEPIKKSKKMILTAAAREMNSGMEYNMGHTALRDVGTSPIILENVEAEILINHSNKNKLSIYPLDSAGKRKEEKIADNPFKISGKYESLYYEILIE